MDSYVIEATKLVLFLIANDNYYTFFINQSPRHVRVAKK